MSLVEGIQERGGQRVCGRRGRKKSPKGREEKMRKQGGIAGAVTDMNEKERRRRALG
jgi:hypothetical protein